MNIVGIVGLALVAAVFSVMLKRYHPEYAVIVSVAAGVVILAEILKNVLPAMRELTALLSGAGLSGEYAVILFKSLGVCFLAQFAADSCRDAGEGALAGKVELAGKLCVVGLSLPLFQKIADVALRLIQG